MVRWTVRAEGGFSSFVVGGGRAFTLVRDEVEGIDREVLVALDAAMELLKSPGALSGGRHPVPGAYSCSPLKPSTNTCPVGVPAMP